MLITCSDSLDNVFSKVKNELILGAHENAHPFHYCALATHSSEGGPGLRTVVLRRVVSDLDLCFYTDERSKKIFQVRQNPELALLFYHPQERLQVRVSGVAIIHQFSDFCLQNWHTIARAGWKSYSSVLSPGERIQRPEDAFSWAKLARWKNFVVVEVTASVCEVLQLNRDEHLRALYEKSAGNWSSSWLSP